MQLRVLAFVLAGGKGTRLYPLTKERAKPAVPFGGQYRIVDFVLSNLINSASTPSTSSSSSRASRLLQHLRDGWEFSGILKDQFIIPVPAQMRTARRDLVSRDGRRHLSEPQPHRAVRSGRGRHLRRRSHLPHEHPRDDRVPRAEARPGHRGRHSGAERDGPSEFGVIETAADGRIVAFHEKNPDAPTHARETRTWSTPRWATTSSRPARCCANCTTTAANENSTHDFGRDILPHGWTRGDCTPTTSRPTGSPAIPGGAALLARRRHHRRLLRGRPWICASVTPALNLYNRQWPLRTASYDDPPAKFTFDEEGRRGEAIDSIVSGGCILSGGMVRSSVLGRGVRVHTGAWWRIPSCSTTATSAARCKIRRAILDKNVTAPRRHRDRLRPGSRTGRSITSPTAASWSWKAAAAPSK